MGITRTLAVATLLAAMLAGGALTTRSALFAPVAMPPLPDSRKPVYDELGLQFLDDGYPGRRTKDGAVAHPLYGTYVINDYVAEYRRTGDRACMKAARRVADAALARMGYRNGSRVFLYTPEMGLTPDLPGSFYDGLTQARYLEALTVLWQAGGGAKYRRAAAEVFNSLSVPVSEGGVARQKAGGLVLEEWPDRLMGSYILNGWTTAMILLHDYAEAVDSGEARALFRQNVTALKALLPLYDVPELANSRYMLADHRLVRIEFDGTSGSVSKAELLVPREAVVSIDTEKDGNYANWQNAFLGPRKGGEVRMNIVLDYASAPAPNRLALAIKSKREGAAKISISTGDYSPVRNTTSDAWVALGRYPLGPGENRIEIPIDWALVAPVGLPTTFDKEVDGRKFNVYHFLHIYNLTQLARMTGEEEFAHYAAKWTEYTRRWADMPLYRDAGAELCAYSAENVVIAAGQCGGHDMQD